MNTGYIIADRYICKQKLGNGSNGYVYLVFDNKLNKNWAVKICSHFSEQEIYALKQINYYLFPRIVDVIKQDSYEYLIMDYIEGDTLTNYCNTHSISEKQAVQWCQEIATGMHYLHNMTPPIIYSDLKPDNIIVTPSGDIRIIDFGSIYVDTIKSNNVTGTTFFAPEELNHDTPTVASDIYSFGMTMYRLLTGQRKEIRDSKGILLPELTNKNLSCNTTHIIKRCTRIDRQDRYHSMADIINELNSSKLSHSIFSFKYSAYIRTLLQFILAATTLLIARFAANPLYCLIPAFLLIISIYCRKPAYSWETKKEIVRITLLVLFLSLFSYAIIKNNIKSVPFSKERLDITLYDKYNCKLLVRPGATWEVDDDIKLSLSKDELLATPSTITITCDNEYGTKSYSFQCSVR